MKIAALVFVAACGFPSLPKLGGDDAPHRDAAADTTAPDAGACMAASVECASSSTLRTCSGAGVNAVDTTCSWGCVATGNAHCGLLQPTGGGLTTTDTDPATLGTLNDITISSATTINGDNGSMGTTRPPGVGIMNGIDYEVSASGVAVFRMKSLMISGPITILGGSKVAIVVDGPLVVSSVIDDRGPCGAVISPGGFNGGAVNASGGGQGAGMAGPGGAFGGGGAGYGGLGAFGGTSGGGGNGGAGGTMYGDPQISMLVGGSGGAGGGAQGALGGHGGGAIQLVSNGILTISPGAGINAGGCGGHTGTSGNVGGAGGGAGGAIVLEAMTVNLSGALAGNGGGGAGGGNGAGPGGDGGLDRNLVAGGVSSAGGAGGAGGAAQSRDGFPGNGGGLDGGGGGGGVGRIRVNTQNGAAMIDANAVLSPGPNDPMTTFTQGPTLVR